MSLKKNFGFNKLNKDYLQVARLYSFDFINAFRINPSKSLVISGFWRSGTTWLQQYISNIIRAKTVWEPLFWKNIYKIPFKKDIIYYLKTIAELEHLNLKSKSSCIFPSRWLRDKDFWSLDAFMPFCDSNISEFSSLYALMAGALKGKILSGKSLKLRFNQNESFLPRVVVKTVRGHLCLRAVQDAFLCPIVHIFRDPRAVIASLKRIYWGQQWIKRFSLKEQLIEPDDGRSAYFKNYSELINTLEKNDSIAKLAGYWALTEKFLLHSFKNASGKILFINYEKICREPKIYINRILKECGMIKEVISEIELMNFESATTQKERKGIDISKRIYGWKNELSASELKTIVEIAKEFGYENRLI